MSWRTVVISNRCKLDLKMGFKAVFVWTFISEHGIVCPAQ